mmetsp:Transcript_1503/g.2267  ORF Transcript_1503/g.2267 Transcript_1503/m.2267 type:complete len:253 (+) Transcript_1503:497-1255(+)
MRTLESALANTILMLFVIPHDILTFPPIRTKRMLRCAFQHHAALRRSVFAREAREGISIHDCLAAATALSSTITTAVAVALFVLIGSGLALSPISTLQRTWHVAMLPDEAGVLAIAARSSAQSRGGVIVGEVADGRFDALAGVAAAAVGIGGEDTSCRGDHESTMLEGVVIVVILSRDSAYFYIITNSEKLVGGLVQVQSDFACFSIEQPLGQPSRLPALCLPSFSFFVFDLAGERIILVDYTFSPLNSGGM